MKLLQITKKRKFLLDKMKVKAMNSNLKNKHCAILVKKNKIISIENNEYNTNQVNNIFYSIHAEVSIDKKLNKKYIKNFNKNKYDLWVIRYSDKNGILDSKPCSKCIKYIKKRMLYVDNIIYSNEYGKLNQENIKEIQSNHISIGYKMLNKRKNIN